MKVNSLETYLAATRLLDETERFIRDTEQTATKLRRKAGLEGEPTSDVSDARRIAARLREQIEAFELVDRAQNNISVDLVGLPQVVRAKMVCEDLDTLLEDRYHHRSNPDGISVGDLALWCREVGLSFRTTIVTIKPDVKAQAESWERAQSSLRYRSHENPFIRQARPRRRRQGGQEAAG